MLGSIVSRVDFVGYYKENSKVVAGETTIFIFAQGNI